jgi:DNA-binding transcriptional MerR regulator
MLAPATSVARAKSPEAFRTISEVSAELDVPQHVLRFWESRFVQIRPVKRAGGRRYYRPEDIDLLRGIRALLYSDGFTIRGVQKILRERGLRHVAQLGRASCGAAIDDQVSSAGFDGINENDDAASKSARAAVEESPMLAQTHAAPAAEVRLTWAQREKLELLLSELLHLKARLHAARKR